MLLASFMRLESSYLVVVVEAETVGYPVFNGDFGVVLELLLDVNTAGSRSGRRGLSNGGGLGDRDRLSALLAVRILNDLQDDVLLSVLTLVN